MSPASDAVVGVAGTAVAMTTAGPVGIVCVWWRWRSVLPWELCRRTGGVGAGRRKIGAAEGLDQEILLPALTLEWVVVVVVVVVAVETVGEECHRDERAYGCPRDPPSCSHLGVACGVTVPHIPLGEDGGTFRGDPCLEHAWGSHCKDIHGASA